MSNEWERPDQPPPPLFLGKKERDLVKQVNDELIENIIGQQILYYAIDMQTTSFHDMYGEAIEKTYLPPIRIYALVKFDKEESSYLEGMGIDSDSVVTVNFHKRRLNEDQNMFVREGDFVAYGKNFYEIVKLEEPQELFGQADRRVEISAECIKSREGLFDGR